WMCFQYIWKPAERIYSTVLDQPWRAFVRNKSRKLEDFEISDDFASLLSDPGAPFTHPRARQLRLEDIFVYPDIKIKEAESGQGTFLPGDDLLKYIQENKQVLLVG